MASAQITSLHMAASKGDVARLKSILGHGADPNAVHKGRAPLHSAVSAGKAEALAALVAAGADVNARDERGQTPLMAACSLGLSKGSASAVALVDLGADVNVVRDEDGGDALVYALMRCRPDVLNRLVAKGAPVDGRGGDRLTPLMKAAVEDKLEAVQALVALGADLRRTCESPWADGKTAEELAVREKMSAVAAFLRTAREKLGGAVADPGAGAKPAPAKARRWYPSSPASASGTPKG